MLENVRKCVTEVFAVHIQQKNIENQFDIHIDPIGWPRIALL